MNANANTEYFTMARIVSASECECVCALHVMNAMTITSHHITQRGKKNQFLTSSIDSVLSPQHQNTPLSHLSRWVLAFFSFEMN